MRRLILIITVFFLHNYPGLQISICAMTNLLFLVYQVVKAHRYRLERNQELMNEFFISNLTILTFLFTDYCRNGKLKYQVGWYYIVVFASITVIAIAFIVLSFLKTVGLIILKVFRIIMHKISPKEEQLPKERKKEKILQKQKEEPEQV